MRRTHATTVYITREQDRALHVLAERTGVPIAQYVREGVDLALTAHATVDGHGTGRTPAPEPTP